MKKSQRSSVLAWLGLALLACPVYLPADSSMDSSPGGSFAKGQGTVPPVIVKTRYIRRKVAQMEDTATETRYNVAYTISYALTDLQPVRDSYPDGAIQTDDDGNPYYFGKILLREKVGAHAEHFIAQSGTMSLGSHLEANYGGSNTVAWTAYQRSDDSSLSNFHGQLSSSAVVDRTGLAAESAIQTALARYAAYTRLYPPLPDVNPTGLGSVPEKTQQTAVISTTPAIDLLTSLASTDWSDIDFTQTDPLVARLSSPTPKSRALEKMQYKVVLTPASPANISWLEIFTPSGASQSTVRVLQSWAPSVGATESPIYTIDPLGLDPDDANAAKRFSRIDGEWRIRIGAIETKVSDRDSPDNDWANAKDWVVGAPIYAGESNGDMVSWKIGDQEFAATRSFIWTATGPDGELITGPSGAGKNEWRISNDGSDTVHLWLDWKPGRYQITCVINGASTSATVSQIHDIGWRTDEYVVVGQVKPMNDIQLTDGQKLALQANLVTDLATATGGVWTGGLIYPPLEFTTHFWFIAQPFLTHGFSQLRVADLPDVGDDERLWMNQYELNNNPDLVNLGDEITPADLFQLNQELSYRMYTRCRFKYTVGTAGKINRAMTAPITANRTGPTKLTPPLGLDTSVFSFAGLEVNTNQILIPAEVASGTGVPNYDRQGGQISSFTAGRVGTEAQYPNYALFKRGVPYIFTEVVYELDAGRRATQQQVRLSVDKVWSRQSAEAGDQFFNEIRIYRRNERVSGSPFRRVAEYLFTDHPGQLRNFIFSLPPYTWPGNEPVPTVLHTP